MTWTEVRKMSSNSWMMQKRSYMGVNKKDSILMRATQGINMNKKRNRSRKKKLRNHLIRASEHLMSAGLIRRVAGQWG